VPKSLQRGGRKINILQEVKEFNRGLNKTKGERQERLKYGGGGEGKKGGAGGHHQRTTAQEEAVSIFFIS